MSITPDQLEAILAAQAIASQDSIKKLVDQLNAKSDSKVKASIDKLSTKDDYSTWNYKVEAELEKAGVLAVVKEQMQGDIVVLDESQKKKIASLGSDIRSSLEGDALRICSSKNLKDLYEVLKELKSWGAKVSPAEASSLMQDFNTGKYDLKKHGSLKVWIAEKFAQCLRLSESIHPSTRETQMRQAIVSNLPPHFEELASRIRADPPATWQEIEDRIIDWDISKSGQSKKELQGQVNKISALEVDNAKMKKELESLKQQGQAFWTGAQWQGGNQHGHKGSRNKNNNGGPGGKGTGGGPGKQVRKDDFTCWKCGKKGHKSYQCRSKVPEGDKGNKGRKGGHKKSS